MKRKIFKRLISADEALKKFFDAVPFEKLISFEKVPLEEAMGRVAAESIVAPIDVPPFDRASMDGYAVRAEDTYAADEENPIELEVIGSAPAGTWLDVLVTEGSAVEISTGAPMPPGANAVVKVEDTKFSQDKVWIMRPVSIGQNVMSAGKDITYGETLVRKGTLLTQRETSVLAAVGVTEVLVYKKPQVAVISTGNEIHPRGEPLPKGKIYDINSQTIQDSILLNGGIPKHYGIIPDDPQLLKETLEKAKNENTVVTISGGTSAGIGDILYRIIDDLGEPGLLVHGVAVQPGKPTILAVCDGVPIIGLPGYPTSSLMIFDLFVAPLLNKLIGLPHKLRRPIIKAKTVAKLHTGSGREVFLLVNLTRDAKGNYLVFPTPGGSGAITTLARAIGYVRVKATMDFIKENTTVDVYLIKDYSELPDLTIIGSHCLGLEAILDVYTETFPDIKYALYNVGSFGGLTAVRRGEADIAGIHILDTKTKTYNIETVKELDVQDKLMVVRGYKREQGFIVQKDNPLNIQNLKDILERDIRFINRNPGSGTRILFDHLLEEYAAQNNKTVEDLRQQIQGYHIVANSHSAVAIRIRDGHADVGVGLRYVAEHFGLSFIPITTENYDFVIRKDRLTKKSVQSFLDTLKNPKVKEKIKTMPGFDVDDSFGTTLK